MTASSPMAGGSESALRSARRRRRLAAACFGVLLLVPASGCGKSPERRIDEIYALKREGGPANIERIRGFMKDESGDVRATALHALVGLRAPDAGQLALGALQDPDGLVRQIAARGLGEMEDGTAVEALGRHLVNDEDWHVRQTAAQALLSIGGPEAVASLVRGLDDPVKEVRLAAVKGVAKLDPDAAFPALSKLALEDPEWEIRVQAAGALGRVENPEAVPVLEKAAEDPNEFVRAAATRALQKAQGS
jgi:HEAT repeat protein